MSAAGETGAVTDKAVGQHGASQPPRYEPLRHLYRDPWIRDQLGPFRRYFLQILAIMTMTIAINFIVPLSNRALVNRGILLADTGFVYSIVALQVFMYMALIVLNAIRARISGHVSNRLVARMTGALVGQMVELPMGFFHGAKKGEFVERVRDLDRVQRFASVEAMEALTASVSIVSLGILLLFVNLSIFLVFFGSAASYLAWIHIVGKRRRVTDAALFEETSRLRALEIGMVEAIQDIRVSGYERASLSNWAQVQIAALHTRIKAMSIEQVQATGGHFFTRVGLILVTLISAQRAITGAITLGDFTITSVIAVQLYFHLNQILAFVNKLEEVRAAMHRTAQIRRMHAEGLDARAAFVPPPAHAPIVFDKVSFQYPGARRPSLEEISAHFPANRMTALVGPSGSGKTTILKLVLQLVSPTNGEVMAAGTALSRIDPARWHAGVGAVLQDGALFAGSLRDNIVASEGFDPGWFAEIVAAARLGDVIASCEEGIDTLVGPGGTRLSAGQTQRLLIARALYKKPHLLVMDEPTSALDIENESAIIDNIADLLPGVTSIVAAHRLNTVERASLVVSLDAGRIAKLGDKIPEAAVVLSGYRRD